MRLQNVNDQQRLADLSIEEIDDLIKLFCLATQSNENADAVSDSDGLAAKSLAEESCRRFAREIDEIDGQRSERHLILARLIQLHELQTKFEQTLQREKLASLKQLAYGASHEVNNPLGNVATRAQTLLRSETDPERRRQLALIVSQAFRAHDMISDMMLYAHPPTPVFSDIELRQVAEKAISEIQPFADMQETKIEFRCEQTVGSIDADANQIISMIIALIRNGLDSLARGGTIVVEICSRDDENGKSLSIRFTDDGPGLSELALRHLFDPFFSGREAGRGLGFGLCKAKTIAELHRGEIKVDTTRTSGVSFDVVLPARR